MFTKVKKGLTVIIERNWINMTSILLLLKDIIDTVDKTWMGVSGWKYIEIFCVLFCKLGNYFKNKRTNITKRGTVRQHGNPDGRI